MRWSKLVSTYETDAGMVLFNAQNTGIVMLEKPAYAQISDDLSKGLSGSEYFRDLAEMQYIVPDEEDEIGASVKRLRDWVQTSDTMDIVFIGTMACNFQCSYCFENDVSRKQHMTRQTMTAAASFVREYLRHHSQIKKMNVLIFGGEPTVNWKNTFSGLQVLQEIAEEHHLRYATEMISNGYLLDDDIIAGLQSQNCMSVQITLDGPREMHDSRRKLRSGQGTFDRIVENMEKLLHQSSIGISLRINLDRENAASIDPLLDFLRQKFSPGDKLNISFGIVQESEMNESCTGVIENSSCLSQEEAAKHLPRLIVKAIDMGLSHMEYYVPSGLCYAQSHHALILHPNGSIYKCLGEVGKNHGCVGNIHELSPAEHLPDSLQETLEMLRFCAEKQCPYIPLCAAGCVRKGTRQDGKAVPQCEKAVFDAVNQALAEYHAKEESR